MYLVKLARVSVTAIAEIFFFISFFSVFFFKETNLELLLIPSCIKQKQLKKVMSKVKDDEEKGGEEVKRRKR